MSQRGPWISTDVVPMTPSGIMSHEHHHKPQLHQEHGPSHALGTSSGLDVTMALVAAQATHISMSLVAARSPDTNTVLGGCPGPGHLLIPLWQQETWTSTLTLAAAGP